MSFYGFYGKLPTPEQIFADEKNHQLAYEARVAKERRERMRAYTNGFLAGCLLTGIAATAIVYLVVLR